MNDLNFTQGKDNIAGLIGEVAIIPKEDILTLPDLGVATTLVTEAATDIVFKSTKKCAKVYFTDETAKAETKSVGERDGKARETIVTGRYPAYGITLEDFIRQAQNTPSVILYKLKRNGKIYMLGVSQLDQAAVTLSLDIPAYFEQGDANTGEKAADQNGVLLGWKFTAAHGPIEYSGSWANLFVAGS